MSNERTAERIQLLKTAEAAAMLGKHPAVLADWRHQSRGPKYIQIGRSIRYRVSDVDDWIEDNTVDPKAQRQAAAS